MLLYIIKTEYKGSVYLLIKTWVISRVYLDLYAFNIEACNKTLNTIVSLPITFKKIVKVIVFCVCRNEK